MVGIYVSLCGPTCESEKGASLVGIDWLDKGASSANRRQVSFKECR